MPRILTSESEAFMPTYKSTYEPPKEDPRDAELRRMGAKLNLAGQALPLASLGIAAADKYLVSPISEGIKGYFKKGREEEYYKTGAGQEKLFDGMPKPRAEGGEEAEEPTAPTAQQIAAQRLEQMRQKEKELAEPAGKKTPEEIEALYQESMSPEERAYRKGILGYKPETEETSMGISTPSVLGKGGKVVTPEYEGARRLTKVGQALAKKAPEMRAAEREGEQAMMQKFGYQQAVAPVKKGAGQVEYELPELEESLAGKYEVPESMRRVSPYVPRETAAAEGTAAAPTAGREHVTDIVPGIQQPGYLPQLPPSRLPAAGATAPGAGGAAGVTTEEMTARRGAAAAGGGPKTLATASEEELKSARGKLQALIDRNADNPEAVTEAQRRLKSIDMEMQHRSEFIPYAEWAAKARAAETPEEQARVLQEAERVGMPVGGLQDFLKTRTQRGMEAALGTREEHGLFPALAKPMTDEEAELKRMKIEYMRRGMTAKEAEAAANVEQRRARAAYFDVRTRAEELYAPRKAGLLEEQMMLTDKQHQLAEAKTKEINEKLPYQINRLKADADHLRAMSAGIRNDELRKWAALYDKRALDEITAADKTVEGAEQAAERSQVNAERAKFTAQMAMADAKSMRDVVNRMDPDSPGYNGALERAKEFEGKANAAAKASELADSQYDRSKTVIQQANDVRRTAVENRNAYLDVSNQYGDVRRKQLGMKPLPPNPKSAAPTAAPIPEEPGIGGFLKRTLGGAAAPAAPAAAPAAPAAARGQFKEGEQRKDKKGQTITWRTIGGKGQWVYE